MLIVLTLGILVVLVFFSLILGNDFVDGIVELAVDNTALIDGEVNTFESISDVITISIDTTGFLGAIIIITAVMIGVSALVGITFLASGLSGDSAKIIIIASTYIAIWTLFSIISAPLIQSIEIFGYVIYIMITLGYTIGVVKSVVGND